MNRGKVVLIPFPFDDLSAQKVRPAVCLTEPLGKHRHIVLAFISSQISLDVYKSDILLDAHGADFKQTGLRVVSVLRLHRLITLSTGLIQRELGSLPLRLQNEVSDKLVECSAYRFNPAYFTCAR
jgi:mRNA interferase MazF